MRWILILLASIVPAIAQEEDRSWHLFTQSQGGTISLLHKLTKHECEFAMNRALGRPATQEEKAAVERAREMAVKEAEGFCAVNPNTNGKFSRYSRGYISCKDGKTDGIGAEMSGPFHVSAGDIRRAECFQ